jgi:hypothetical protein
MPLDKNNKSKWQEASNLINSYRWKLSDLLRSFSDEERQTENYKDLIKDIKESAIKAVRDVSPKDSEDTHKKTTDSDKINWKSYKIWALILASPLLIEIVKALVSLFGQGTTP